MMHTLLATTFVLLLTSHASTVNELWNSFVEVKEGAELLSGLQKLVGETSRCCGESVDERDEADGIYVASTLACAAECQHYAPDCAAFAHSRTSKRCVLLKRHTFGNEPYIHEILYRLFVTKSAKLQVLALRVSAGVGADFLPVYTSPVVSHPASIKAAVNFGVPLTATYKGAILEHWNRFSIEQVYLSFKKSDGVWANVVFSTDSLSSKTNWMRQSLLVSSPWQTELTNVSATIEFGLKGFLGRRAYMMTVHNSCPGDYGYFMVVYLNGRQRDGCSWANLPGQIPAIIYAPGKRAVKFADFTYGVASEFSISVRLSVK